MSGASEGLGGPERATGRQPEDYGLPGNWLINHEPQRPDEWALETRLRLEEWARSAEAEVRQYKLQDQVAWATGKRPESKEEWDLEYRFRQLDQHSRERELNLRLTSERVLQAAKSDRQGVAVRSYALLGILTAVVLMPAAAMLAKVPAGDFSQFIAPVTGIAGTIIGYWFGQRKDEDSTASPLLVPENDTPEPLTRNRLPEH